MSRRHAFRHAGLDLLEGRIAPSAFSVPRHLDRRRIKAVHVAPAKSNSITDKLQKFGGQVQNFLGLGHKAVHPAAKAHAALGKAGGTVHPFRRG